MAVSGDGPGGAVRRVAVLCWPLRPLPQPARREASGRGHFRRGPRCLVLVLLSFPLSIGPRTQPSSDPPPGGCHQLPAGTSCTGPVARTRGTSGRLPALGPHCRRPPLTPPNACCSRGLGPRGPVLCFRSFQPWPAPSPWFSCVLGDHQDESYINAERWIIS